MNVMQKGKFSYFYARYKAAIFAYIMMLVVVLVYIVSQPSFFTVYGIKSTFDQLQPLIFASLAQTLVVLTGGIDLSVGAAIGLTNCIAATYMMPIIRMVGSEWLGILLTIALTLGSGCLIGLLNAFFVVKGNLQPMVVTLASSFVLTGAALVVRPTSGGEVSDAFVNLAKYIPNTKIPMSIVWLLVPLVFIWLPIRRSRFGQSVYAIGGNESSAFASGIHVEKVKWKVYLASGLLCAGGGLILTAYNRSGSATGCESMGINAVAATVLGGTALTGGKGGFVGTVAGVVIYSLILGLLIFWGVNAYYQSLFKGAILIIAVAINLIDRIDWGKGGKSDE